MTFPIRLRRGRGVRRTPGQMNGLEREYAAMLEARRIAGEIAEWHFDAVKLRLAEKTFYSPDFMVMMPDGMIEYHEVKGGFIEDDASVKIKVAASKFPFRFVLCQKKKKKEPWTFQEIGT